MYWSLLDHLLYKDFGFYTGVLPVLGEQHMDQRRKVPYNSPFDSQLVNFVGWHPKKRKIGLNLFVCFANWSSFGGRRYTTGRC